MARQTLKLVEDLEEAVRGTGPELPRVLSPIRSEADFKRRSSVLDALLDKVGDDETHPLAFLCDAIGRLIEEYEERVEQFPTSKPEEIISFLMEQRGLKQTDLSDIIPQSNLSAVLRGKRALTPLQIRKLSSRLGIPGDLLLPTR